MKKYLLSIIGIMSVAGLALAQSVKESNFGKTKDGMPVKEYTLKNKGGMTVKILDYGCVIREIWAPDRNGKFGDVVLGFDKISDYEAKSPYFGAVVGRYGNRIGDGKFSIDGTEYQLPKNNNGVACLHGGKIGFDKKIWKGEAYANSDAAVLKLSVVSPDGDQGFPGNLSATVVYTLNNKNELVIDYSASTDKPTVCNLTNHSYFNLAGAGRGSIANHEVIINADKFTVVDKNLIPTGELRDVSGTPFDFRKPKPVGARIEFDDEQLKIGGGYDHNFVLNQPKAGTPVFAVRAYEPVSGRILTITTTEPGVQFYAGNVIEHMKGKGGKEYFHRGAFAFETQHFPDSPNRPEFPSTLLRPNQTYNSRTVWSFSAQ